MRTRAHTVMERVGARPSQPISTSDQSDQPSAILGVSVHALCRVLREQGGVQRISVCVHAHGRDAHASNSSAHAASATQHHLWEHVTAKFEFGL